jgi:hypothetical protein
VAVVVGEAAVRIRADADPKQIEDDSSGPIMDALGKLGGKGAALLGGALGGLALADAFGTAMENGALNDKLAAQLGFSEDESARVGGVAGKLYANAYGDSLEGVNEAVAAVIGGIGGMRDASSADLEAVTGDALNFASAMGVDVSAAATSAGILVKTGLADNAATAFDLMTKAAQEAGPAMVEPVLDAANEYGTNFAAMGFSGREAMALLVDASRGGEIALDKAGDAVKEFGIRATDLSDTGAQQALKAIGLNGEDMANALLAGGDTAQAAFQKIVGALQDVRDPAAQAQNAVALFGTPLEDIGKDKIPGFLDSMTLANGELENVAGAADRMGKTLNDNASTNLTSFGRQASQLAVNFLGGQLLPIVDSVASSLATNFGPVVQAVAGFVGDDLVPVVRSLAEWIGNNQTPILIVAGIIGSIFLPHLIALGVQSVITAAQAVGGWLAQQAAVIASAAVHSAQIAMMILRWVAMGAAAILNAGLTVGAWIGMGIAAVVNAGIVAAAWLGAQIATVASLAVMAAGFIAQGAIMVASVLATVASVVAGWVVMAAGALLSAGQMALAWFIALGPIGWVIAIVVGLVALIIANWETVKNFTVRAFHAVVDAVVGAFHAVVDAVSSGIGAAVSFVSGLPGKILGALVGFGSLLYNKGRELIQGLVNGIASAASFVGNIAKNIVNAVIGFVNANVIDGINGLLEFTVAGVKINPPDIPRIPKLHSGGVFDSGSDTGEGLALLRDRERVVTPEQETAAGGLLAALLDGNLPAGRGGVSVQQTIVQQPGESAASLAARVTQGVVWNLNGGITRAVTAGAGA